jgi:heat shock protein HtpX
MFLFLFDPVMLFSILIAYVLGMLVMFVAAQSIAPRVAKRVSGKLSLRASMALLGLVIVVGGLAGVLVLLAILGWLTNQLSAVSGAALYVLIVILLMNGVIYLISPWIINLSYGAKHDPELQRMVDEIAKRSGLSKPPKAVVVNGPPNAFAYGNFLAGRWVAVSSEMLRMARKDELEAVIGHELGHHRHGDNAVMLFMGLIPSFLYYLGLMLIQSSFYYSAMSSENRRGGGGIFFMLTGVAAIVLSFVIQILVLAFSRLREYYADAHGASVTSPTSMQRALARLHVYYRYNESAASEVAQSKLRALFIYAFTEAVANPFYRRAPSPSAIRDVDIDEVVERLKKVEASEPGEFLSSHPPIPKRIRFLEDLKTLRERY